MSTSPAARRARISSLIEVKRYDEARSAITTELASDPDEPDLHGLLARCLLGAGEDAAALSASNRYVRLRPDDEWGHRLASIALDRLGQHREALVAAAEAVRLAPLEWRCHARYAEAATAVPGRLVDALSAARRGVQLAPNEPGAHFALGVVQQTRNDVAAAREAYRRVLALEPDHASARNNLVVLDNDVRLASRARGFVSALRADPSDTLIQENLETVLPQLVLRLWLGYGVALVLALLLTGAGGPDDRSEPTPVTYAIAAMLPIATVLYVRSVVRHLPGGIAREMWRRARSSLLNVWNLVVTAALLCVALAVCVVPGAGVLGVAALRPLALSIVVGVVVYVVQRQRR